jgi:hypothetical protein
MVSKVASLILRKLCFISSPLLLHKARDTRHCSFDLLTASGDQASVGQLRKMPFALKGCFSSGWTS